MITIKNKGQKKEILGPFISPYDGNFVQYTS